MRFVLLLILLCAGAHGATRSRQELLTSIDFPKTGLEIIKLSDLKIKDPWQDWWGPDIPHAAIEFPMDSAGNVNLPEVLKYHLEASAMVRGVAFKPNRIISTSPTIIEHRFTASNPRMKPTGSAFLASCDEVKIAYKKNQSLHDRFKQLRTRSLELLERTGLEDGDGPKNREWTRMLQEMAQLRVQIQKVYPEKFFKIDRKGDYRFFSFTNDKNSDDFYFMEKIPVGTAQVMMIKLGGDAWLPLHLGLKGLLEFPDEPRFDLLVWLTATRYFTPLQACTDNLDISIIARARYEKPKFRKGMPFDFRP